MESSEQFLKQIIETIPDAVIVVDEQARILEANARVRELLGYALHDLLGKPLEILIPIQFRDRHRGHFKAFLAKPKTRTMSEMRKLPALHKDGSVLPVDISLSPLVVDKRTCVMAVIHDIRRHVEMENALRDSEEKYRLLVENASDVFYQIRFANKLKAWNVVYASPQVEQFMGHPPERFMDDPNLWIKAIHPEDLANTMSVTQEILKSKQKKLRLYRLLNFKTGEYHWIEDQVVPLLDETGHVTGFQGAMRDVTERELSSMAIQNLTDQLQHYLTKSPTITYALCVKNRTWVPKWKSENISRILGYTVEESLSSTWWETTVHPDDLEAASARSNELYEKDTLIRVYRFLRKDGSVIWVYDEMRLIRDKDGTPLEAVGSWTDITERKKMEEVLLASEESLNNIINAAPFGALIYKLENGRIRLTNSNDTATQVLGMDRETLLGINIEETFPALRRTEIPVQMREVILSGTKFNIDQFQYSDENVNGIFELHAVPLGGNLAAIFFRNISDLAQAYEETLEGWSRAMDFRDKETEGHTQRVTQMALAIAQSMGLTDTELMHMRRGALLHDMGKMAIPDSILLKKGDLDEEEWTVMRKHPEFAHEMLRSISFLHQALEIPYCHHEKWDGSGYPRGLKGEEIPLSARIFAVADVWDALRNDRPYRKSWNVEKVLRYIKDQTGKHFDPQVADVFLKIAEP